MDGRILQSVADVLIDVIEEGRGAAVLARVRRRLPHLTEAEIGDAVAEIARLFVAHEEARVKARIAST